MLAGVSGVRPVEKGLMMTLKAAVRCECLSGLQTYRFLLEGLLLQSHRPQSHQQQLLRPGGETQHPDCQVIPEPYRL